MKRRRDSSTLNRRFLCVQKLRLPTSFFKREEEDVEKSNRKRRFRLNRHGDVDSPLSPFDLLIQTKGFQRRMFGVNHSSESGDTTEKTTSSKLIGETATDLQENDEEQQHYSNEAASLALLSETGLTGVTYDFTSRAWRASYRDEKTKRLVYVGHFTLKMFGDKTAHELALLSKLNWQKYKELGKDAFRVWVIDLHRSIKGKHHTSTAMIEDDSDEDGDERNKDETMENDDDHEDEEHSRDAVDDAVEVKKKEKDKAVLIVCS